MSQNKTLRAAESNVKLKVSYIQYKCCWAWQLHLAWPLTAWYALNQSIYCLLIVQCSHDGWTSLTIFTRFQPFSSTHTSYIWSRYPVLLQQCTRLHCFQPFAGGVSYPILGSDCIRVVNISPWSSKPEACWQHPCCHKNPTSSANSHRSKVEVCYCDGVRLG